MMTDQKTTGIPNRGAFSSNGTRSRVQLVKPNQVNNVGRSAPNFNPVQPRAQAAAPSAPAPVAAQPAPETAQAPYLSPPVSPTSSAPNGALGVVGRAPAPSPSPALSTGSDQSDLGLPSTTPTAGAIPSTTPTASMQLEQARAAIRGMTPQEIGSLLDELASGSLRGI